MKYPIKTLRHPKHRIPWGYNQPDENSVELEPIEKDLDALFEGLELLDNGKLSIVKCADFVTARATKSISPSGLTKLAKQHGKYKTKSNRGAHVKRLAKKTEQEKSLRRLGKYEEADRKKKTRLQASLHAVNKRQATRKRQKTALDPKKPNLITDKDIEAAPKAIKQEFDNRDIIFKPNPGPQVAFLASSEREVFYGGARGGGKSYSMLVDPLRFCHKRLHRALILRRTMPELRQLIDHSRYLYPRAFLGAKYNEEAKTWAFPSGAKIEFGYAENATDALRYQGQSYTWIGVDELPQYPTPKIWNDLRGSLRSVDPEIPEFMRATGNPGNVGSGWVKDMFIDPAPWGEPFKVAIPMPDGADEYITRRFIPAKLSDNPYLTRTSSYRVMLASLPPTQRKQWLEGDWDAYDNAAFPDFDRMVHVIEPFDIPNGWVKFRGCDWGYSSPACVIWLAVDFDGNLYAYREYYGKGLVADRFAQKIKDMEAGEGVKYGIMDSSVWARRGETGPSVAEVMAKEGLPWRPADRSPGSRKAGKMELHRRLGTWEDGDGITHSNLYIFSNCRNLIRTLPTLPIDDNDPEDVDTKAEDHAYDALRYACMSRPLVPIEDADTMYRAPRHQPADPVFGY